MALYVGWKGVASYRYKCQVFLIVAQKYQTATQNVKKKLKTFPPSQSISVMFCVAK